MEPVAGDLVWVDFDPTFGHEQSGRRPALIVSTEAYNRLSSFVIVCPITRNVSPWSFKIEVADVHLIEGQILVDRVKSIDKRRIVSPAIGRIGITQLAEVRGLLATLFGFISAGQTV